MFTIGDKIAYPMHGAGVIEGIEEKSILGEVKSYYILRIAYGDMKIMIPIDNSNHIGVRHILSSEQFDEVIKALHNESTEMSGNWNRRLRENTEKLKSGDLFEVAEVLKNLVRIDRTKKLSTGEKKMMSSAKQILVSEMILVKNITTQEASDIIENAI